MTTETIFRGRRLDNGELVEGHGIYFDVHDSKKYPRYAWIISEPFPLYFKAWHRVDPATIEVIEPNPEEAA